MLNRTPMEQLSSYPHLSTYVSNLKSIPGGTYRFGFTRLQCRSAPRITMSPFRMGATPVTWGMWKEYCEAESVRIDEPKRGYQDNHPVVLKSWADIMYPGGYCEWAIGVAGLDLTLPSDAQWDYAARGGQDGLEYPWGNEFDTSKLWCSEEAEGDADTTAAVDRKFRIYKNAYGLTDMVGNVWEWCKDSYIEPWKEDYDYRPSGTDPVDTRQSELRCIRGGSWEDIDPDDFRCAHRNGGDPLAGFPIIGFRLCAGPG
jgi:sulfatase modifying factor 1